MNVNQGATYRQYAPNDRIPRRPDAPAPAANVGHAPLSSLASSERARNPQLPARPALQQQLPDGTRQRVPISALPRSNPGPESSRSGAASGGRPAAVQVRNELNASVGSTSNERNASQAREGGRQTNANDQQSARPPSFASGANAAGNQNESRQEGLHQRRPSMGGAKSSQTPKPDQRMPQTASLANASPSQDVAAMNRQYNSTNAVNRPGTSGRMRQSTSETRVEDRLAGQKIKFNGLDPVIKPYQKTKDALLDNKTDEAFAPKEASDHIDDTDPEVERLARVASIRTHLEVYFPWRTSRRDRHQPKECRNLCDGHPHPNKQIVCRFCKKGIEPNHRDHVKFNHESALDHLHKESTNCTVPPAERKMLYDAFLKIDASAFQRLELVLGTPKWNLGFRAARPVPQIPRAKPTATSKSGASTITAARRPSLDGQRQQKPKAVQPIAAKVATTKGGALHISPRRTQSPKGQLIANRQDEVNKARSHSASGSHNKSDQVTLAADQSMDSIQEEEGDMYHHHDEAVPEPWGFTAGAGTDSGKEAMSDGEEDELEEDDAFIYEPLPPQEPGTPPLRPRDFEHLQPVAQVVSKPAVVEELEETAKDVLQGQTVSVAGFVRPIRPYQDTLELIRQDNTKCPFEVREATEYTIPSLILRKKNQRTYLEVYFPWRSAVRQDHDPSLCGNVCSGQPHFYDGPICRFCKKGIRRQSEAKSQLDLLVALNHMRLRGKCDLPDDEKELLVQAIEQWDAEVLVAKKEQQQRNREKAAQQAKLRETSAQEASLVDHQRSIATQTEYKAIDQNLIEEEEHVQRAQASRPSILPTPEPSDSSPHSPRVINGQRHAQLAEPLQPLAVQNNEASRERKSSGWNLDAQGLLNSIRNASMPARTVSPIPPEPVREQPSTELSMEEVTLQAVARVLKLAQEAKQAAASQASTSAWDVVEETDDEEQQEVREWPTFTENAIVSRLPENSRTFGKMSTVHSGQSLPHAAGAVVSQSKLFKSSSPPEPEVTVKVEEVNETPEKALLQAAHLPSRPNTAIRKALAKAQQMSSSRAVATEASQAMQFDDFEGGMDGPAEDGKLSSDSEGTDARVEKELFGTSPTGEHHKSGTGLKGDAEIGTASKGAKKKGPKSAKKSKAGKEVELSAALFPEATTEKKARSKDSKHGKNKKARKEGKEKEKETKAAAKGKKPKLKPQSKGKAKAFSPVPAKHSSEEEEQEQQDGSDTTDDSRYGTGSDSDSSAIYVTAVPAPKSKIITSRPSTGRLYSTMHERKPKVPIKSKGSTVPTAVSNDTESDASSSSPPPRSQGRKSGLSFIKFGGDQLSSRPKSLKRKRSESVSSDSSFVVADKEEKKMHGTYRDGKATSEEESSSGDESEPTAVQSKAPLSTRTGPKVAQDSPKPAFTRGVINAPTGSHRKRNRAAVSTSESESEDQSARRPQKKARKVETQAPEDSGTSSDEDLPLFQSVRASQNGAPAGTGRKLVRAGDMDKFQTQSRSSKPSSSSKPAVDPKVKAKPKERVKPKDRPRPKPSVAAKARLDAMLQKRQAEAESTSSESEKEIPMKRKPSPLQRSPSSADPLQLESPPRQIARRNAEAGTSSIEPPTSERKPNISTNAIEVSSSPEPDQSSHSRSVSRVDKLPDYLQEWEKVFLRSKLGTVEKIRKTVGSKTNIPGFVDHLVAQCKNEKDPELREFADDWGGLFQFKVALGQLFA